MVRIASEMKPESMMVLGNELVLVWSDGHESYYPLEDLRRACPCAGCSGEPDLFGRIAGGGPQRYSADSFRISALQRIGNYAIQPDWADGHTYGIWTFERLRDFCPCPAHRGASAPATEDK